MTDYFLLGIAAFLAGFVDAVVGGGGLIQLPALFSVYPQAHPASLLGTSKFAGVWGTSVAAVNYLRSVSIKWSVILPAALAAFLLSFVGAMTVTHISPIYLRKALPLVLALIACYTFWKKDLGSHHKALHSGNKELFLAICVGAAIGFYDGFFGPGTGSFFIFIFVRVFGYDFLHASASAKVLNVACNFAALLWFGYSGNVMWVLGLGMAFCGVIGSVLGTRTAIKYGSGFVRILFLGVVSALVLKTAYDAFLR
ncbi:TSUP family transporter [Undibacterium sp. LX40W]|uniref:Probable membrane transporter protein n=1 Tax=Undibacterium nitidum TaxID=2762298 RepID=A0A923HRX3_9BURK|nr:MULTISPECIES: TSUP family transporter [Undibacterium]MBC3882966.1 TSUP family transporter [Undibacterium nitidum]MBC3893247.1 TSUP family transporter [Undibacterium sp. LX40W]